MHLEVSKFHVSAIIRHNVQLYITQNKVNCNVIENLFSYKTHVTHGMHCKQVH